MEPAPGRHPIRAGNLPKDRNISLAFGRVRVGDRLEQRAGIRVLGRREDSLHRPGLNHAPQVHHRDDITDISDDAEVMAHEQIRQPQLSLDLLEQVENPGLD